MLDYLVVKKFYAVKLAEDAEGTGRVESAFYHAVEMAYLKGVEDGEKYREVGITDHPHRRMLTILSKRVD